MNDELKSKRQGMHEVIANRLREEIVKGWRAPGSALGEADIAATFNTSRNPVREALRCLEAEGYVQSRRSRGVVVAKPGADDIFEMIQVRQALEPLVVRLAATRRSEEQFVRLRTIVREAHEDLGNGNFNRLTILNSEFHQLIAEASGNKIAAALMNQLLIKGTWAYGLAAVAVGPHPWKQHADLVSAIERRDADAAEAIMKDHLSSAESHFETRRSTHYR